MVLIGFWTLRGIRRGVEKGRCPLCNEEENESHILLKRKETHRWREQFLNDKWLCINEEMQSQKITNANNVTEFKNLGKFL
jgi:hypothetical protein